MTVVEPSSLEAVPQYHQEALGDICDRRQLLLNDVIEVAYDPEGMSLQCFLGYTKEWIHGVLSGTDRLVQAQLAASCAIVEALATPTELRDFQRLHRLTLPGGRAQFLGRMDPAVGKALLVADDSRVMDLVLDRHDVDLGVWDLNHASSPQGRRGMRAAYDFRILEKCGGDSILKGSHLDIRDFAANPTALFRATDADVMAIATSPTHTERSTIKSLRVIKAHASGTMLPHMVNEVAAASIAQAEFQKIASATRREATQAELAAIKDRPLIERLRHPQLRQARNLRSQIRLEDRMIDSQTEHIARMQAQLVATEPVKH